MKNVTFFTGFALILFFADTQQIHFAKNGFFKNYYTGLIHKKDLFHSGIFRQFADASFSSPTLNYAIPDEDEFGVSHTLTASGIPGGATIDSVIVTLNITHTYLEDLVINLEAPNGQVANRGGGLAAPGSGYLNTRVTSDNALLPFPPGIYNVPITGTYRADKESKATIDSRGTITNPTTPFITTSTFSNLFSIKNGS